MMDSSGSLTVNGLRDGFMLIMFSLLIAMKSVDRK